MRYSWRDFWRRMPVDGWGFGASGDTDVDRIRRHGAIGFWRQLPAILRPPAMLATRALWTIAAAQRVRRFSRTEKLGLRSSLALYWDCLISGERPADALIHRRNYGRRHPFPGRAVVVSLGRLGDPAEHRCLLDKLATAERLAAADLAVPALYQEIIQGSRADFSVPPWTVPAALLIKPRHGSGGRGVIPIDVLAPGVMLGGDGAPVPVARLGERLARLAQHDSLLVQERLLPVPELAALAYGPWPPVLRLNVARTPGAAPAIHSAYLALNVPGIDASNALRGRLRAPLDLATGRVGPAILFAEPGKRFAVAPWNGAQIAGLELPRFAETITAVLKASAIFSGLAMINWELVPSPRGPVFLEGNSAGNWNTTELCRLVSPDTGSAAQVLVGWLPDRPR